MACDITKGRARVCKDGTSGNSKLYLFNFIASPFTIVAGVATAINVLLTVVYEYALEGDGNIFAENMPSDVNTGTTVNTQTITSILKKQDAATSMELNLIAKGNPQAVILDRNGVAHAIGLDDGIDFTIDATTGGVKTDLNGYTLTGVSTTGALSPKLDAATLTAFQALV